MLSKGTGLRDCRRPRSSYLGSLAWLGPWRMADLAPRLVEGYVRGVQYQAQRKYSRTVLYNCCYLGWRRKWAFGSSWQCARGQKVSYLEGRQWWRVAWSFIFFLHARVLSCFSHVWLFVTLWNVVHQAPLSMGILQARILECVSMPFSRRSSQPRDQTQVSHIAGGFFSSWTTREAQCNKSEKKLTYHSQ